MMKHLNLFRKMKTVRRRTGKGYVAQISDIWYLKRTGLACGATDYYCQRLYDHSYVPRERYRDFVGWRAELQFSEALNPRKIVLPGWDKLAFAAIASTWGIPIVPIQACFQAHASAKPAFIPRLIRNLSELESFFNNDARFPLFGKPSFCQQGYGSQYIAAYRSIDGTLVLHGDKRIPCREFYDSFLAGKANRFHQPAAGYLFQPVLSAHPAIADLQGHAGISGVRLVTLNDGGRITPFRAIWKIMRPWNITDNFRGGASGNLIAGIDIATGAIHDVLTGFWPDAEILSHHPDTGRQFEGFVLPDWPKILEIVSKAGPAFPMMRINYWDIALTDRGPLILELNDSGATPFVQLHGHGLLEQPVRSLIKATVNPAEYSWVARL